MLNYRQRNKLLGQHRHKQSDYREVISDDVDVLGLIEHKETSGNAG